MLEALVGLGGILIGWIINQLIKAGAHKRDHEMISEELNEIKAEVKRHDQRLDEHDVVNAAITEQLRYISLGIDEIKERLKGHD